MFGQQRRKEQLTYLFRMFRQNLVGRAEIVSSACLSIAPSPNPCALICGPRTTGQNPAKHPANVMEVHLASGLRFL
jgi:hypothetical protein